MKINPVWCLIPAALVLGACKKKEPAESSGLPANEASSQSVETTPTPEIPAVSPEQRAQKLGFARHLPADTAAVISVFNGSKHAERIKGTKLWQSLIDAEIVEATDDEADDADQEIAEVDDLGIEDDSTGPAALLGKEFTIAVGDGTDIQTENLITLNKRVTHFQLKGLTAALARCAENGSFDSEELAEAVEEEMGQGLMQNLLDDPESGIALFESMKMPPIYVAFGTTPENRSAVAQQLASSTEFLGLFGADFIEPIETEINGEIFAGNKISGEKISVMMAENRENFIESIGEESVDRLIAAIASKDTVIVSGLIGDYAVMFIGASLDDLRFVENPVDSLVGGQSLAFCDEHLDKDLAGLIYGEKDLVSKVLPGITGMAEAANGMREGLANSQGLGDTRDLQNLLRIISEREKDLQNLMRIESTGTIAYVDDGLKIDSYGGIDHGGFDWTATNRLAGLEASPNVAMFVNINANSGYRRASRAYLEAWIETAYAMALKVAELPIEDDVVENIRAASMVFDNNFRNDAVTVWNALSQQFASGLGSESAWIIDLNGTPPAVPGIPQNMIDDGKFPRITMLAPVTERAKLAEAWEQINTAATQMLSTIGEMQDTTIPMQKPLSSERNGYTTWFFPVPFFTDDFLPSVTVGDEWFAASTSKNQALDLLAAAGSGESTQGFKMRINFNALSEFATITSDLMEKNSDELPIDVEVVEATRKVASALDAFDYLDWHTRMDGSQLRTTIHLKTR
ncbi:MAG: hypothetical protein ACO3RV_02230 [Luteolibacter sp.]